MRGTGLGAPCPATQLRRLPTLPTLDCESQSGWNPTEAISSAQRASNCFFFATPDRQPTPAGPSDRRPSSLATISASRPPAVCTWPQLLTTYCSTCARLVIPIHQPTSPAKQHVIVRHSISVKSTVAQGVSDGESRRFQQRRSRVR